ncbi:unnamed protein product, partial [Polarella glacialis]
MWAPLVWPRPVEVERSKLIGSLVEIGEHMPGPLSAFAGQTACIIEYKSDEMCYMACVGQQMLPLERSQIKRLICHHSEANVGDENGSSPRHRRSRAVEELRKGREERRKAWETSCGQGPGQAPVFKGIPDGSVEFQLLFELVSKDCRHRLGKMQQELSGRGLASGLQELRQRQEMLGQRLAGARSAAPSLGTQPWQPQAKLAQPKAQPQPRVEQRNRRLSLTEAVQQMSQGSYVWVRCPNDNIPSDDEAHRILGARLGDELRLSQAHLTGEGSLASGFLRAAR